ncbi:MAG: hypothetical protein OK449_08655 [Thaumarchaeota archaeon]|nr:hypothetical protein [Nitrososphaerota archaeon]
MTVTGFAFSGSAPVTAFTFNGVTPSGQDCTSQTTVPNYGSFSCTFTVPDLGPGPYTVSATVNGGFSQSASTTFTIATSISLYSLDFAQSGLDASAQGTILSFTGGEFSPVSYGQLPTTETGIAAGTPINYAFASPVPSSNDGEQFVLTATPSPASGFAISADTTVTGTYETQYLVAFEASPAAGGTTSPSSGTWYDAGAAGISISASTNPGYSFGGWVVQCVSGSSCIAVSDPSSASTTITVNAPGTLVATFQVVSMNPTTTSVSCFPATTYYGAPEFCTVIITDTASHGASDPTGSVTFSVYPSGSGVLSSDEAGTIPATTCTLGDDSMNGEGQPTASCTSIGLWYTPNAGSAGTQYIIAQYGGDSGHSGSISATSIDVSYRPTATTVTCTPPSAGTETCTAWVQDLSTYAETTPTGDAYFLTSGTGAFTAAAGSTFDTGILGVFDGCTLAPIGGSAPNTLWTSCSVTYNLGAADRGYVATAAVYVGDTYHLGSSGLTSALDSDQALTVTSPPITFAGNPPYAWQWLVSVNGGTYVPASQCTANSGTGAASEDVETCSVSADTLTAGDTYSFELNVTDSSLPPVPQTTTPQPSSTVTVFSPLAVPSTPTVSATMLGVGQELIVSGTIPDGTPTYAWQWLVSVNGGPYAPATQCAANSGVGAIARDMVTCDIAANTLTIGDTYSFELQVTDGATTPETQTSDASPLVTVSSSATTSSSTSSSSSSSSTSSTSSTSITTSSSTSSAPPGVPQFPAVGGLGALILVALLLPTLMLISKRLGKRPSRQIATQR